MLLVFVKLLDNRDIRKITETFQSLDYNAKGYLELEELNRGFQLLNDQMQLRSMQTSIGGSGIKDDGIGAEGKFGSDSDPENEFLKIKV